MPPEDRHETDRSDRPDASLDERYPGLEVLKPNPANAQTAERSHLESYLTSREDHYIRTHHRTPSIDARRMDGVADRNGRGRRRTFHGRDQTRLSDGIGRAHDGVFGERPGVLRSGRGGRPMDGRRGRKRDLDGHAGARDILDDHGAVTEARRRLWLSVMGGEAKEDEDVFCRSIPMEKALEDCLLAYEMNGDPMTPEHGYPLRLLVPGWFGTTASNGWTGCTSWKRWCPAKSGNRRDGQDYTEYQQSSYRIVPAQDDEPERYESVETLSTYEQLQHPRVRNAYLFDQLVKSLVTSPTGEVTPSSNNGRNHGRRVVGRGRRRTRRGVGRWRRHVERGRIRWPRPRPPRRPEVPIRWDATPGEHKLLSRATDEEGGTTGDRLGGGRRASRNLGREVPVEREGVREQRLRSARGFRRRRGVVRTTPFRRPTRTSCLSPPPRQR